MKTVLDYRNKNILAPMVRCGTLPTRLLSLDYGADLVYSEEIIDHKMLQCRRVENGLLDTTDFILNDGTVVFRTCAREKKQVVFQMGTCNAQRALKVAKMLEQDVAAIDINMGCPKEFSLKGGMGAALLTQPDKIKEILTTLVDNLNIPVTCKIRILPTLEDTLSLVRLIENTGIQALGVHGRLKEERPRHDNHNDVIKVIAETISIPVIANGGSKEINCYEDIAKFKSDTGCSSVMLARAAEWNPSIFRKAGLCDVDDVVISYLKYAIQYDNEVSNTKYCVQHILHREMETDRGTQFKSASRMAQICDLFGMSDVYQKALEDRQKKHECQQTGEADTSLTKTICEDGRELIEMPFVYNKKEYDTQITPKTILYEHCKKNKLPNPLYEAVRNEDNSYNCSVCVGQQRFTPIYGGISKKFGEQGAAVVCLRYLGIHDGRKVESVDPRNAVWRKNMLITDQEISSNSCKRTFQQDDCDTSSDNKRNKQSDIADQCKSVMEDSMSVQKKQVTAGCSNEIGKNIVNNEVTVNGSVLQVNDEGANMATTTIEVNDIEHKEVTTCD